MRVCQHCNFDVPSNMKFAILNNSCPSCGKEIMPSADKELLDELRTKFEEMKTNTELTADELLTWLCSNYSIQKIGSAEITTFYRPQEKQINNQLGNNSNEFKKRAGVNHTGTVSEKWLNAINLINNQIEEGNNEVPEAQIQELDPYTEIAKLSKAKGGKKVTAAEAMELLKNGGNSEMYLNQPEMSMIGEQSGKLAITAETTALASLMENELGTAQVSPVLENERLKRLSKQYLNQQSGKKTISRAE